MKHMKIHISVRRHNLLETILICTILLAAISSLPINKVSAAGFPELQVVKVYWGQTNNPIQASPGDLNDLLNVVVQNTGEDSINWMNAKLSLAEPFEDVAGNEVGFSGFAGSLSPGTAATLSFSLNISPNAELGDYELPLELAVTTPAYSSPVSVSLAVKVPLYGEVKFSAGAEPDTIYPGFNNMTLYLLNEGKAAASNIEISLSPPSNLALLSKGNYWINEVEADGKISIPLQLYAQQISTGLPLQLPISISYTDSYGNKHTIARSIGVTISPSEVGKGIILKVSQNEAAPGDIITLHLTISNQGNIEANNIELSILPPQNSIIIPVTESSLSLGSLSNGSETSADFSLKVSDSALAATYPLNVMITYLQETKPVEVQQIVGVEVKGPVRLAVQRTSVTPLHAKADDNGVLLSVWLMNDGSLTAENGETNLLLSEPFKPSWGGSDTVYLGKIQPSQIVQANFYLDIDENATSGGYSIPLNLSFREGATSNKLETTNLTVPFYIYEKAQFEVEKITADPVEPKQGDSGVVIKIQIKNIGSHKADGVMANLAAGEEFSGTMTTYVGTTGINESKDAEFNVDINSGASAGVHDADLVLSWSEDNEPFTQTIQIKIQVNPAIIPPIYIITAIFIVAALIAITAQRKFYRKPKQQPKPSPTLASHLLSRFNPNSIVGYDRSSTPTV